MKRFLVLVLVFALGVTAGGWLFAGTRWRPLLATDGEEQRIEPSEFLGLLGSIAVRRAPGVLPRVVMTTRRTVAFVSPRPEARTHWVIVPRRDIKDVADLRAGDEAYLVDAFAVAGRLARENGLRRWQILTRGPEAQAVRYLHFHLLSNEETKAPRREVTRPRGR